MAGAGVVMPAGRIPDDRDGHLFFAVRVQQIAQRFDFAFHLFSRITSSAIARRNQNHPTTASSAIPANTTAQTIWSIITSSTALSSRKPTAKIVTAG